MRHLALPAAIAVLVLTVPAPAGSLVQNGSLSGGLGTSILPVPVDRFDTLGGARRLDGVQLDVLTAVTGGGTTTGSGTPVDITAELSADYTLGMTILAQTSAVVDTTIANTGPPTSFSVFDNDTDQALITDPADFGPWLGTGPVGVQARVTFAFSESPPLLGFSAGGSVQYTLTYDFTDVACIGDVDESSVVDVADLVDVILSWGDCPGCPADVNGDLVVDVADLVAVILAWGTCSG